MSFIFLFRWSSISVTAVSLVKIVSCDSKRLGGQQTDRHLGSHSFSFLLDTVVAVIFADHRTNRSLDLTKKMLFLSCLHNYACFTSVVFRLNILVRKNNLAYNWNVHEEIPHTLCTHALLTKKYTWHQPQLPLILQIISVCYQNSAPSILLSWSTNWNFSILPRPLGKC